MIVPGSVQRDVEFQIQEGINKANEHFGRAFSFPSISYDLRGKTAGTATYQKNHIRLNAQLLMENKEHFINQTVKHELAHLITWEVYKDDSSFRSYKRIAHHGSHWKSIMRLLGAEESRCHSYDVSKSTARKTKQYVWQCNSCQTLMPVGKAKHTKMLGGGYHHKCGNRQRGDISFVVSPGAMSKNEAVQIVQNSMTKKESAALRDLMQEVKKPDEKKVRKPRKSGMSNMARARSFVRKNPGLKTSAQIRSWLEASIGVSAHSARGIYSKLKKEGLV